MAAAVYELPALAQLGQLCVLLLETVKVMPTRRAMVRPKATPKLKATAMAMSWDTAPLQRAAT